MKTFGIVLTVAIVVLVNCAPRATLGPVYLIYPENRPIEIELRSFSFHPDHIAVLGNQSPYAFRLTNTANTWHNFTLLDSHKNAIVSINLKPTESTTITLQSLHPANYVFYCNRFLHRPGGMEGMLMVE